VAELKLARAAELMSRAPPQALDRRAPRPRERRPWPLSAHVGWIAHCRSRAALKKAIILCGFCVNKWNAAPNGYVTNSRIPFCGGKCDGCREIGMDRRLFIHHTNMPR
jgi:hypothetical protein